MLRDGKTILKKCTKLVTQLVAEMKVTEFFNKFFGHLKKSVLTYHPQYINFQILISSNYIYIYSLKKKNEKLVEWWWWWVGTIISFVFAGLRRDHIQMEMEMCNPPFITLSLVDSPHRDFSVKTREKQMCGLTRYFYLIYHFYLIYYVRSFEFELFSKQFNILC